MSKEVRNSTERSHEAGAVEAQIDVYPATGMQGQSVQQISAYPTQGMDMTLSLKNDLMPGSVTAMVCLSASFFLLGRWWGEERRQKTLGGLVKTLSMAMLGCVAIVATSMAIAWMQ